MHLPRVRGRVIAGSLGILIILLLTSLFLASPSQVFATEIYGAGVDPKIGWNDTGVDVSPLTILTFKAEGIARGGAIYVPGVSYRNFFGQWRSDIHIGGVPGCTAGSAYLLPLDACWSYIAKIGQDGTPFPIGTQMRWGVVDGYYTMTPSMSGRLFVGPNAQSGTQLATTSGGWGLKLILNRIIPSPTPSPSPSPTPIPTPQPFLDLPWEYGNPKKTISDIIFDPVSWFDHQYPLQNVLCCIPIVLDFTGKENNEPYRSHNGYDYGLKNGVEFGTPVLAAAGGTAAFRSEANSGGAGNMIKIDHGNGYQTWYEHLQIDGLIIADESKAVSVTKGQQIGKVGMTGNTDGPHIHFSVFKDSNNNESFDDDIPHGVVDPLGWEGSNPDPWPFVWTNGLEGLLKRTGTVSYPLFLGLPPTLSMFLASTGGSLSTDTITVSVPSGTLNDSFTLTLRKGPFEAASTVINSIVPSFFLNAFNTLNQEIHEFLKPITLTYDYSNADLFNTNEDSLSFYHLNEETNQWEILPTTLDTATRTATTNTMHFSHFALMGEVKDLIAPTTEVVIEGDKGQDNWYRSTVTVQLNGIDNDGGVGLHYTLYRIDDDEWQKYETPLVFDTEGTYTITYQSFDNAENTEEINTTSFTIDTTAAEALISIDPITRNLVVVGNEAGSTVVQKPAKQTTTRELITYTITDSAGNTTVVEIDSNTSNLNPAYSLETISYHGNPVITLPWNEFVPLFTWTWRGWVLTDQTLKFPETGEKVTIEYNQKNDESTITTITPNHKEVITKEGLILLHITTDSGIVGYSY